MPIGRQAFGWQLKFESMFISDWKDPTPCQVVEEMLKLEELFPMQEFKVPPLTDVPKPQFNEYSYVQHFYVPSTTDATHLQTPITVS